MKNKCLKYIAFSFFVLVLLCFSACQTSRNTQRSTKYTKVKTRYQPHWNSTTSQSTTYYIKKHSTKNNHNSKKLKR